MNFDAVAAFVLATPMWIGVFVPLLTETISFTDDIDSRGSTSFGRKRRRRNIRTYTRKRHLKEFRGLAATSSTISDNPSFSTRYIRSRLG